MARSKTSHNWLKEHFNDPFVKMAQKMGTVPVPATSYWKSRKRSSHPPGHERYRPGSCPGWLVAGDQSSDWRPGALDRFRYPGDGQHSRCDLHSGDFTEDAVFARILEAVGNSEVDLVISDMAPNMSGLPAVDMPRAMFLCELALDLASRVLRPGGDFLIKIFQGRVLMSSTRMSGRASRKCRCANRPLPRSFSGAVPARARLSWAFGVSRSFERGDRIFIFRPRGIKRILCSLGFT